MIDCQKCQETSCAKQVSKQKLTVFTCTAYKAKKVNMTQKEPKENKLFESVEQLSKIAQDLVRRKTEQKPLKWCSQCGHKCPSPPQPEQEPVALPCCGYADASAIKWNPHNQVVQCHNCGQIYTAPPQRKPLTDEQIMANDVLRYHFALNGGAGPISKQGRKVIDAIEAAHGIKE